jgi:hypothetical protein
VQTRSANTSAAAAAVASLSSQPKSRNTGRRLVNYSHAGVVVNIPSSHRRIFGGGLASERECCEDATETEHHRALAEAAEQARSERRRVIAKMRALERSNGEVHQEVTLRPSPEEQYETADSQSGKDRLHYQSRPKSASRQHAPEPHLLTSYVAARPHAEVLSSVRCRPTLLGTSSVGDTQGINDRSTSSSASRKPPRTGPFGRGG